MKRKAKKEIVKSLKNKEVLAENLIALKKSVLNNALFKFVISALVLIYSLVFYKTISKLAIITCDTVLNHILFIEPVYYYYISLGVLAFITLITIIIMLFKGLNYNLSPKFLYYYYRFYDLASFIMLILVIINFIIMFILTPVTISGSSMENTYHDNDKVFVWHFCYEPDFDDVVIVDASNYDPSHKEVFYIKRIAALPNQELTYLSGELYVDGNYLLDINQYEWYTITQSNENTYQIPTNKYLILGDNRNNSYDSRSFGLIDKEAILGKAILRYYPFKDFGIPQKDVLD